MDMIKDLSNDLLALETTNERLESGVLLLDHVIQDLAQVSHKDVIQQQTYIKLKGIYSILSQAHEEFNEVSQDIDLKTLDSVKDE